MDPYMMIPFAVGGVFFALAVLAVILQSRKKPEPTAKRQVWRDVPRKR